MSVTDSAAANVCRDRQALNAHEPARASTPPEAGSGVVHRKNVAHAFNLSGEPNEVKVALLDIELRCGAAELHKITVAKVAQNCGYMYVSRRLCPVLQPLKVSPQPTFKPWEAWQSPTHRGQCDQEKR